MLQSGDIQFEIGRKSGEIFGIAGIAGNGQDELMSALIGEWPYYLITFQLAGILFMMLIYLPMWIAVKRNLSKELVRG